MNFKTLIKVVTFSSALIFTANTFEVVNAAPATQSTKKASSKKTKKTVRKYKASSSKSKARKTVSKKTAKKSGSALKTTYQKPVTRSIIKSDFVATDLTSENPLLKVTPKLVNQRKYFKDAEIAVKNGDEATALRIKETQLQDYPLAVWIDFWALSKEPDVSKYPKVVKFIAQSGHHELSSILKDKYIDFMAKNGRFRQVSELIGKKKPFADDMEMNSKQKTLQCRYYEARWHRGEAGDTAQVFANKMYMQLSSYPSGCSGLVSVWAHNGYLNDTTKLDKFERAYITKKYASTTRNLANDLDISSKFKRRVEIAMSLYDNPEKVMSMDVTPSDSEKRRALVLAFKRYANLNPNDAAPSFDMFVKKFGVSPSEKLEIIQVFSKGFLGRKATLSDVKWVDDHLPAIEWNEEIKLMRMRKAIWFGQWKVVYELYNHLNANDKNEINWRYWKARAAFEIGMEEQGRHLMSAVAKDRSFFGFLAAQELGREMPFNHESLSKSAKWPDTVAHNEAAKRFFEFRVFNSSNANVEWNEIAKYGTNDEAMIMAEWALSNGNVAYAISSVIAGKRWDALDYRFPKAYLSLYKKYASYSNVPISFLYGISRQESMLNPSIKSPVGAVGLMQLMPATAQMVSRKNNWPYSGTHDLVIPENNIRLGSAYLRDMLDRFDNNRILAAAAYNAGPNRIRIWKSNDGKKRDTPMFVENIPFKETRLYVQNVILYDVIYKKLITGKSEPLLKSNERKYRY